MMKKLIYTLPGISLVLVFLVSCKAGSTNQDNNMISDSFCLPEDSIQINIPVQHFKWQRGPVLTTQAEFLQEDQLNTADVLVVSGNGTLFKVPSMTIGQPPYEPVLCPPGDVPNPRWGNGVNKIYSPCPQVNIGIGTYKPEHKLDIRGTAYMNKLLVGSPEMTAGGSVAKLFVRNNSSDIIQLGKFTESEEVYFKVTNNGTVYVKEIWVKGIEDFPDYVFEPDYELLTLDEVEQHIDQHGRLPKMPEALEVNQNGLDLADTQVLLVEKIEELTLYVIELKNELDLLRAKQ